MPSEHWPSSETRSWLYLRARWYDATTGRFNRLDPFFGNLTDPQSLHKYAYVHGDPIQGVDPTGKWSIAGVATGIGIGAALGGIIGGGSAFVYSYFYAGNSFSEAFYDGLEGGKNGAITGAIAGLLYPVLAPALGYGATSAGFGTTATSIIEFYGASAISGGLTGGFDSWLKGQDPVEGAVTGLVFGLLFSSAGQLFGKLTRGVSARLPANATETQLLSQVSKEASDILESAAFQRASGIADQPELINYVRQYFGEMTKLIATRGGAAGTLNTQNGSFSNAFAVPLKGLFRPAALSHELAHVVREAKARLANSPSPFKLEEALKKYDPDFWRLWLGEEIGAFNTQIKYMFEYTARGGN
jgi:RHS repeat-associated protein